MKRLLTLFLLFIMFSGASLASVAVGKARLFFFYSEDCKSCQLIKHEILPPLIQKYGQNLEIRYLEISSPPNFELLLKLERESGKRINKTPPLIMIGNDVLEGAAAIRERLDQTILKYYLQGGVDFPDASLSEIPGTNLNVKEEFHKLSLVALVLGALVDGINPCAFSTLVFLISYLSFIGRRGKQLILSGLLFSLGVFIAYFLAGIGLVEILNRLQMFALAGKIFRWLIIGVAILFGLLNLGDWMMLKKGRSDRVKLGLGINMKQKIHSLIRAEKPVLNYLSGCLLGGVVGLLELPCTGQVYLPIIFMIREVSAVRLRAIGYLLLYNFIFVMPLVMVFVGVYLGLTNEVVTGLVRRHLLKVKLLTAFFFFSLAMIVFLL
ncbi:MAG: hypothetical protein GX075_12610 [Firmicutes bacterium]|nr:hypothetical protein [Bacillota bacterium]